MSCNYYQDYEENTNRGGFFGIVTKILTTTFQSYNRH